MAKKKVEAATVAPPPVTDASEVTKKTRKTATAASATTPAVKTKAAAPRRKAVAKPVVAESTDVESVANLAAVVLDPREVEERAYLSWVERGCPMGSPDEDWYRAEQALLARAVGASA